ncbi:5888_t:CDS:2 [Funneliformis mosseae]|uniref:5888_t:CDS:1 n=1 Tax=Funneliformis mosseae TaxID=27381 RepID=A0A9N8V2B1_FUNMO|nr:5888_t:CDS:2 [Funneliformis mosseae]
MLSLSADCVYEILKYVEEDIKTVHSCVLINRMWCETSVPILWRNPWKVNIPYIKGKVSVALFTALFSCLEKDIKRFFYECNIHPFDLSKREDFFNEALFQYPKYGRSLDLKKLSTIIGHQFSSEDHKVLVNQEILKMILSKSRSIKKIIMLGIEAPYPLSNCLWADDSLSQLVELQCDCDDALFYFGLARHCRNIEKLDVICGADNLGLTSLIELQNSLKSLRCEAYDNLHEFGKALSKYQSTSLLELEIFEGKCIPIEFFSSFINLKRLKIGYIEDICDPKDLHALEYTILPNLEFLSADIELPRLNILTRLISSTIGNLTHIFLGSYIPEDATQQIEPYHMTISNHCPNLYYVSTFFYEGNGNSSFGLEELIRSCNKLRGIIFNALSMNSSGFDLFNLVRRFAPSSLCDIKIVGNCGLKSCYLEWFLESWRSRRPLSLSISEDVYELSEKLERVKNKFLD